MKRILLLLIAVLMIGCADEIKKETTSYELNTEENIIDNRSESDDENLQSIEEVELVVEEVKRLVIEADNLLLRKRPVIDPFAIGTIKKDSVVKWLEVKTDQQDQQWYKIAFEGNTYWIAGWFCEKTEQPLSADFELFEVSVIDKKEMNDWSMEFQLFEEALHSNSNKELQLAIEEIRDENKMIYTGMPLENTVDSYNIKEIFFVVPNHQLYDVFSVNEDRFVAYDIPFEDIWSLRNVKLINAIFIEPTPAEFSSGQVNQYHPIVINNAYVGGSIDGKFFRADSVSEIQKSTSKFLKIDQIKKNDLVQVIDHGLYRGKGILEQPAVLYMKFDNKRLFTNVTHENLTDGLATLAVSADWDITVQIPIKQVNDDYLIDLNSDGKEEVLKLEVVDRKGYWTFDLNGETVRLLIDSYPDSLHLMSGSYWGQLIVLHNSYFIDLNGDGWLEYVNMKINYELGDTIEIYDFSSGKSRIVIDHKIERGSKGGSLTHDEYNTFNEDEILSLNECFKWSRLYPYYYKRLDLLTDSKERLVGVSSYNSENSGEGTYDDFKYVNPYSNYHYSYIFDMTENKILWSGHYGIDDEADFHDRYNRSPVTLLKQSKEREELMEPYLSIYNPILINNSFLGGVYEGEFFDFNEMNLSIEDHYNADFKYLTGGEIAHQYKEGRYLTDYVLESPRNSTDYALNYHSNLLEYNEEFTVFSIGTEKVLNPVIPEMVDDNHIKVDIDMDGQFEVFEIIKVNNDYYRDIYHLVLKNERYNYELLLPYWSPDDEQVGDDEGVWIFNKDAMFVDINEDGTLDYIVNSEWISELGGLEYERRVYDLRNGVSNVVMSCRRFDYN